ncbi:hypothetical protein AVEN_27905-1 [Araneus ventricosus]|uniref:Uncharacterized protein n=1 Tax=Araneus ventricosus TaxID=182803 RepID=A0A4Y2HLH3_ARAVE|nr:hypothetical protein AVEN_27905-1 [Araneus ventricosus]
MNTQPSDLEKPKSILDTDTFAKELQKQMELLKPLEKPGGGKTQEPSPQLDFDHLEQGRLVVGHPGVRLASGVEGRGAPPLQVGDKDGMLDGEREGGEEPFRRLELGFRLRERRQRAV